MWRPDEVLPQYKRRAVALWTVLIGSIILYSSLILYQALKKRNNPSVSFEVSNTVYEYPDIWVCLYGEYGCDSGELEEECMESAQLTGWGNTSAVFYPGGGEYEQTIPGVGMLTPEDGWCVEFETSTISHFLGQERNASYNLDYLILDMYWYPGGTESDSNTCVVEGWEPHSEWIYVKLKDPGYPESGLVSTGIQVPYSCITNVSSSHSFTYVGIGVTIEERLGEEPVATNKALSVSTATHRDKVNAAIDKPYAQLSLQFQQEPNSLEVITENDPFDLAEMFGNVGGFWDLLMLVWPIFFVAASRQDPHLKPRNFKKSVAKGLEGLRIGKLVTPRTRNDGSSNPEDEDVKPHWERNGSQDVVELDHPTSKKSVHRAPV
ncbi:unnamed protein product [Ectocarpus sp. CCAP 1310/34]|nr:unnamed protein product [Ectocarpus sp. CCAP 1310/34]